MAIHNALILLQTLAVELGLVVVPEEAAESRSDHDEQIHARIA